ncbi:FliG family flagellar motor switch protein [Buttiauxella ferragutiae ATCC 51602]|jgi:flagellar motor switch protein FliG|uniref:Flagellar motor switch protein FliG n=1 Tax=Buttiauxella ferragutiae ATCC 51602 TaxID=1354252 RepID=A0ABX2W9N9_9ENTR|nr:MULTISPECIES: FliG C-terminal domain-containing protein [Buttiauxella]OAT28078.1 FliG family flagellar motor switch protein [Buttiauxella ferragutiae ATCC 51602]TDN49782.1 flagellar motor switch protein FliG [Buttiauxella sp. JUb87]
MSEEIEQQPLKNAEQAGLLLLTLSEHQAGNILRSLSREHVQEIVRAMTEVGHVKNQHLEKVLSRLFVDYRELSGISRASRGFLERTLDVALGPELAKGVINDVYGEQIRENMHQLQWISPALIASNLQHEMLPLQATFLALLPQEVSAEVMKFLPQAQHNRLILNMANLREINQNMVAELEKIIQKCLTMVQQGVQTSVSGIEQAAGLISRYHGNSAQLLENVREHDQGLAEEIENNMYRFSILERQPEATIVRLCQEVEPDVWAKAIKGATPSLRQAILRCLPKRQANAIQDQMRVLGGLPASVVRAAEAEIMTRVRELIAENEDAEDGEKFEFRLFEEKVLE